jgi:flavin reductase (DIM6/NTAB) family NADH-FMN oxidoreductase RutF
MRVFPQGVVVVTAAPPGGERRGITVSSFTSVSLEPPLVVICILKSASAHEAIEEASAFAVNILAEDQGALSDHFAKSGLTAEEQFGTVEHQDRDEEPPLIDGCLGYLDCTVVNKLEQADHTLFFGEVQAGKVLREAQPLVFFSRQYRGLAGEVYKRD